MGGRLQEVCALRRVDRPRLRVVKMGVSTIDGEKGVRECSSDPVKGIAVSVVERLKADVDVNLPTPPLLKSQIRDIRPNL